MKVREVPKNQAVAYAVANPAKAVEIAAFFPDKAVDIAVQLPDLAIDIAKAVPKEAIYIASACYRWRKFADSFPELAPRLAAMLVKHYTSSWANPNDWCEKMVDFAKAHPNSAVSIAKGISEDSMMANDWEFLHVLKIVELFPRKAVSIAKVVPKELVFEGRHRWDEYIYPHCKDFNGRVAIAKVAPYMAAEIASACPDVALDIAREVPEQAGEIALLLPALEKKIIATFPQCAGTICKAHPERLDEFLNKKPRIASIGYSLADTFPELIPEIIKRYPMCAEAIARHHPSAFRLDE